MGRSRVLSFMSAFGGPPRVPAVNNHVTTDGAANTPLPPGEASHNYDAHPPPQSEVQPAQTQPFAFPARDSPARTRARADSRPTSIIQTYQPPLMEILQDTLPELQPIFSFLNSHSNKLYQEGYFLKLNDLDAYGRPNTDRHWTECFAQLVGTVLSLWDAAALDAAGQDGEVAPTFINLADASIKMIETLPTRNKDMQPLQNVLSISTAGKNRYLFHFNSLHSLTQWTAGIRLAMFEHSSLQEAYTGSLIAGKGKFLNNIRVIMERNRVKQEDWARVRFGAGTPWRRCWCVISPPDEKEYLKQQKSLKKRSVYDKPPTLKGDIKFYDTKKVTKKTKPIASITDAYSAYAIYPQSKPLIDQSTLVKVEGRITIHSEPESTTEGFVFVMPEVHPAVSGFEMMLRWLFPVFDTFGLYGRPNRLVADTLDTRSLMFAFPQERRYGYLEILDISGLILTDGSHSWSEREWRKQLKDLTARRMMNKTPSRSVSRRDPRSSLPSRNGTLRYDDNASIRSSPSVRHEHTRSSEAVFSTPQKASTSGTDGTFQQPHNYHSRSRSEAVALSTPRRQRAGTFTRDPVDDLAEHPSETPPPPPPHGNSIPYDNGAVSQDPANERSSSEEDTHEIPPELRQGIRPSSPPAPVLAPPAFSHQPGDRPTSRLRQSPELTRTGHRMSSATLSQLVDVGRPNGVAAAGAAAAWKNNRGTPTEDGQRRVNNATSNLSGRPHTDNTIGFEGNVVRTPLRRQDSPSGYSVDPIHDTNIPIVSHSTPTLARPRPFQSPSTNKSILRKPIPRPHSSPKENVSKDEETGSLSSLRNAIDQSAMDRIIAGSQADSSEGDHRRDSASLYDDDSTDSPDYASTRKSTETKRSAASIPKPRMGVLKTVGNLEHGIQGPVLGDAHYSQEKASSINPDIPAVDFGPTMSYDPSKKTRPTVPPHRPSHERTPSGLGTPGPEKRRSFPLGGSDIRARSNSPKVQEDNRRSMAWQPGINIGGRTSPGPRLTPEEFVQHRAINRKSVPVFSHQRSDSATPPPLSRTPSGDWTAPSHNRNFSNSNKELPPRPGSRGAGTVMASVPARPSSRGAGAALGENPSRPGSRGAGAMLGNFPSRPHSRGASVTLSGNDYSSHLSAREQEHVARMTGAPLITMAESRAEPQAGLVGAIEARERERREFKTGVSGQMVQQAIAQRQQVQQQQHLQQQQQALLLQQQQQYQQQLYQQQYGQEQPYNPPYQ